ncbi:MAG: hypothetical protein EOO24_41575, partial [Comamonadaceae bacterium]
MALGVFIGGAIIPGRDDREFVTNCTAGGLACSRDVLHWNGSMSATKTPSPSRNAVHELLAAGIASQVPRLEALMGRLNLQAGIVEEVQLEDALHALHAGASALDFRLLQVQGTGSIAERKAQA